MAHYFSANHDLKLIAVYSPKCACESIKHWFLTAVKDNSKGKTRTIGAYQIAASDVANFPDYYKVLFLRDPLHRLVSFYANWVVRENISWCFADHDRRFSLKEKSFRKLIYVLDHLSKNGIVFQHHLLAQTENLSGIDFDRVILVENLGRGLDQLNQQFEIDFETQRHNSTQYKNSSTEIVADRKPAWLREHGVPDCKWFYDEELRELAMHIYASDLALHRSIQ